MVDLLDKKFIEEVHNDEWEVETPSGWQPFSFISKTVEYEIWELKTTNNLLKCADNHIVYKKVSDNNLEEVFVKDLVQGDMILCKNDLFEEVIEVTNTELKDNMYDLSDVGNGNIYYTNNIASHNTTTTVSYLLHYCLFNPNVSVAILANKAPTAKDILERFKMAYQNLPRWLQQGVVEWNKHSVTIENGSKIIAAATSSSAVRGGSYSVIVLDEFGFVPNNIAEEFFSSVYPTITSGKNTKLVIISTPNGLNHFYKIWDGAVKRQNNYVPVRAYWYDVPGRNIKFKKETIANTSEKQWRAEYECEFLGSDDTLISGSKLATLSHSDPTTKTPDNVLIYEQPIKNRIYTLCADTCRGMGSDYHAFSVIDCTSIPYKVVATFQNNQISHQIYPHIIRKVAEYYNQAYVLMETNDLGEASAQILKNELEYPNIVYVSTKNKMGQVAGGGFGGGKVGNGLNLNYHTKRLACSALKDLIENDKLIISDFNTISELSTFIAKGVGYEANEGYNDDLVISLVLFAWLSTQPYFRDYTNVNVRRKIFEEKIKNIEESIVPFGVITDGYSDLEEDGIDVFDERSEYEKLKSEMDMWKDEE